MYLVPESHKISCHVDCFWETLVIKLCHFVLPIGKTRIEMAKNAKKHIISNKLHVFLLLNEIYISCTCKIESDLLGYNQFPSSIKYRQTIDDFRGACAFKGNGAVAGHVKRVDHDDVFDALLFREETLTRHYFKLKFDFSWGIRTNMGKTEGIFLNLQCNCHIVGFIIIKLIIHNTVHGCQI